MKDNASPPITEQNKLVQRTWEHLKQEAEAAHTPYYAVTASLPDAVHDKSAFHDELVELLLRHGVVCVTAVIKPELTIDDFKKGGGHPVVH